jgi:hypothetical protein
LKLWWLELLCDGAYRWALGVLLDPNVTGDVRWGQVAPGTDLRSGHTLI